MSVVRQPEKHQSLEFSCLDYDVTGDTLQQVSVSDWVETCNPRTLCKSSVECHSRQKKTMSSKFDQAIFSISLHIRLDWPNI